MKVPFGKTFTVTPAQLRDGIAQGVVDGFQDHDGAYKSRSGLTEWSTGISGTQCDGIYVDTNGRTVSVSDGIVYVTGSNGVARACTGETLNSGVLCTFCEDGSYVFIGHGGYIAKVDTGTRTVEFLNTATAPEGVTHVAFIQGYLISNGSNGVAGDTFFTGPSTIADYLSVFEIFNNESLPDGNLAVMQDGQFIYAFGPQSVEISYNDGVTPWAKYSSSFIQYGIHARYSVVSIDNTFYWLGVADNAIRVMKMQGGVAKTLSTPYDAVINQIPITTDAYAYSCGILGHTFYVVTFPNNKMTLVYHIQMDAWYRWGWYDSENAEYKAFAGRCHAFNSVVNKNLMGTSLGANISEFSGFTDIGNPIRFELTSGNVRAETYKAKRASRMRFQLQRGVTTSPTAVPYLRWQHRDDGGAWSAERNVSLGSLGQYGYLGQLDRCGIYRERQHRIVFDDPTCQLVFVEIEEQTKLLKD
jgi:hypothetical protein